MCLMPSNVQAQCPTVGSDVALRFANVSLDCVNDSLFVDIQVSNPTGANYAVSSMSLRFTFNSAMLGSPVIAQTVAPGAHSLAVQSGIWSYGVVDFGGTNIVPAGGAWQNIGTIGFPVLDFDAAGNPNCIALNWQTTLPAITTIQEFINFGCQPNMNIVTYGNESTCIADSCSASIPDSLTATFIATNVTCSGSNDGTIDVTVNGGVAPYTFAWSNGATTEDLTGLAAGSYSITITDDNSEQVVLSSIPVAASSLTVLIDAQDALCNASDDGSIATTVSGGTAPYTYNWSNGETTSSISGLMPGTFDVTVTDANGCTGIVKNIMIGEPGEFIYNVNLQNVSCAGGNDGSLDFSLTGGTPPYAYTWIEYDLNTFFPIDTFATTEDVSGLETGLYSVEITDANGCTGAVFYIIQEPNPIVSDGNTNVLTNITCFGGNDGAIDLTASGGFGVLSFEWSNGSLSEDIDNLIAGIYTVTITDLNGCFIIDTFEITQPDSIDIDLISNASQSISCFGGSDGVIDITTSGGTPPYSYFWNDGILTEDRTGLSAGTYSVTITDSLGCESFPFQFILSQPDSLELSVTSTSATCTNPIDGTVDLTVSGGTPPYSYLWSNGSATQDISNLAVGTYTVTVTDSLGCVATIDATVELGNCPPLARNDINNTLMNVPVSGDISTNDSDPDGDNLTFTVLSGTGPSNGTLTAFDPATGIYTYTPNNNFVGEDSFSYVVCDDGTPSLCDTATVYIEVLDDPKDPFNNPPVANADHFITYEDIPVNSTVINNDYDPDTVDIITVTTTFIVPATNGTATVAPNGDFTYTPNSGFVGNDTLIYQICDNGTPGPKCDTAIIVVSVLGNPGDDNLPPVAMDDAYYTELNTAVDGNVILNDYDPDSNLITVTVPQFSGPTNGTVSINPDGTFTYTPNGGYVGPDQFVYILCDNGVPSLCDTATVYILIQNPGNQPPLARNDINNTLVDTPVSGDVSTNDREPDGDAVTFTQISSPSNGTIASFDPNTGIYTYTPNSGFIGTDVFTYSICDDGTPSLCDTATVTIHVIPPHNNDNNPPVANPDDYVVYAGDTLDGTVIPNDFDPDTADIISVGTTLITPPSNGTVTNIQPNGDFTYIPNTGFTGDDTFEYVLCDNGTPSLCDTAVVTIHVIPGTTDSTNRPPVAVDDAYITEVGNAVNGNVILNDYDPDGDVITVTVPQFSGPANGTVTSINPNGTFTYVPNPGYTGPDQFTYVICDGGTPSLCDTATVYITIYDVMTLTLTPTDVDCFGDSTGTIDLTVNNGTPPYTYQWSNGAITEDLTGVPAGTYTVTVTDFYGVTVSDSATVGQPAQLVASVSTISNADCFGAATGALDLAVTGGTAPYTYAWSPGGATSEDTSGLLAGTYTVTVTDANGCSTTASGTISEPDTLTIAVASVTDATCSGFADGAIDVTVDGGTGPYTYAWSPGAGATEDTSGLLAGTYTLVVTDANGCTATTTATVGEADQLQISLVGVTDVSCNGFTDGAIDIDVTGGTAPFTYAWSAGGGATQDTSGLAAGSYTVVVIDANGCSASATYNVTEPNTLTASLVASSDATCAGDANGAIDIDIAGGTGPFTYAWSPGAGASQDTSGLLAGTYTVVVTDANGCTTTLTETISEPDTLEVNDAITNNVTCAGGSDGSIQTFIAGGTAPYTFAWSPGGATSQDTSGLMAGTYTVTITDANGCTADETFTITEPDSLDLELVTVTDVTCAGANDGAIDLEVTGGTAPYTYSWTPGGATSQDTSGLEQGTYTVVVTDANGCTATTTATIDEDSPLVVTLTDSSDVNCFGDADGSLDITVTGGVAPYTYSWSPGGGATEDTSGLLAGTYSVTVLDNAGCSATGTFTIAEPTELTLSTTKADVACAGDAAGSIDLTVSGGTAPYSYTWSTGDTTEDIAGLTEGIYSVIVTDANGCTESTTVGINTITTLVLNTGATNATCGDANGVATVTVSGGSAPYTYAWSNGDSTASSDSLAAGTYTVTVTEAGGCAATASVSVNSTNGLTITPNVTDVTCGGTAFGSIDLTVTGGSGNYTYLWSTNATSSAITNLRADTYTVTVTDTTTGCVGSVSVDVEENSPVVLTVTSTDENCGQADGSVTAAVSGGAAPYSYAWSTGDTTATVSGLAVGFYQVTIADANGCTASGFVTIGSIGGPVVSSGTVSDLTCANQSIGSIDIEVTGGTAPYTYNWSNGAATQDIGGLLSGPYVVTVTDANGCKTSAAYNVDTPNEIVIVADRTDVSCNNANDGSIDVTVSGGTAPYAYAWSNSANTEDLTGLTGGSYTITVTDANGCPATTTVVIEEPNTLVMSAVPTDVLCAGGADGTVDLTVTGGTAPYSYYWSTGDTTQDLTGLIEGLYSVIVTDANGCSSQLTVGVNTINTLVLNIATTNSGCNETVGVASISVSGGSAPYQYLWSTGDTTALIDSLAAGPYSVTVIDANGCTAEESQTIVGPAPISVSIVSTPSECGEDNGTAEVIIGGIIANPAILWSNGDTTAFIDGLAPGAYTVTVTDPNGCSEEITTSVANSSNITIALTATDANCGSNNGSVASTVTGGNGIYSYLWSTGDTTGSITGVGAGTYTLTVTDSSGCMNFEIASVGNIDGPSITLASVVNPSCANAQGSIDIDVTGGTTPYTYNWSNTANTQDISGLGSGPYSVTVTDANGCSATAATTISVPDELEMIAAYQHVTCNDAGDGVIDITTTGGTAPYTYAWSGGLPAQEDQSNLLGGTYNVTVTDANGCSATTLVTIAEPDQLTLSAAATDVLCNNGTDGSIDLTITGGTAGYTILWSNGATTEDLTGVTAGLYVVAVTDTNGCTAQLAVTVGTANSLTLNTAVTNATCGDSNGSAAVFVSGGSAPYTYAWASGAAISNIDSLQPGIYPVTVTDANGCSASENVVVEATSDIDVAISATNVQCGTANSGSIDLTVTGGSAPYTYNWSGTTQTGANISGLASGTYNATITDDAGCSSVVSVTINEETDLTVSSSLIHPTCGQGSNAGAIDLTVTGGAAPYTVVWSNGETGTSISGLSTGTYIYTITDANGCTTSEVLTLTDFGQPNFTITATDLSCGQSADGSIDLTPNSAGSFTYTWSNGDTTQDINNLTAGVYSVTVVDDDFCVHSITVEIAAPDALHVVADRTDVDCNGAQNGGVDVTVTGGLSPYTYAWSAGLNAQQDQTGLNGGSYTVSVTDANGCFAETTIDISEPDSISVTIASIDSVSCNGLADGAVDIDVTGGTSPYTYQWAPGNGGSQDTSGLVAGTYTVTVTDANGCSATLTAIVDEPDTLNLTVTGTDSVTCNGGADGSAIVDVTGGTQPYTYTWNDPNVTGANPSNLGAGSYWVIATDANGCASDTAFIDIFEPDSLSAQIGVTDVTCSGFENGEIRIKIVNGGIPPYSFNWNTQDTTNIVSGLTPGTYSVTITDGNGCEVSYSVDLEEAETLDMTGSGATNVTCPDSTDGSIEIMITGGSAPYTYLWSTGDTSEDLTGLAEGTYSVTIYDENGCSVTESFEVGANECNNPPVAVRDTAQTFERSPVDIGVILNDFDPDGDNIMVTGIVTPPNNGTATQNSDQTITYTPEDDFVGIDSFTYIICDDGVPALCDTAVVIITVLPNRPNIEVPNAFSPNGDGVNDMFVIEDITEFPDNKLTIFNRWGNEVYEAQPYNNNWDGKNKEGKDLPDGTYFYILEINDAEGTPPYTGYVVIHRGTLGN